MRTFFDINLRLYLIPFWYTYLPAAKTVPLADPKVDITTVKDISQAIIPSTRFPNVCKTKNIIKIICKEYNSEWGWPYRFFGDGKSESEMVSSLNSNKCTMPPKAAQLRKLITGQNEHLRKNTHMSWRVKGKKIN